MKGLGVHGESYTIFPTGMVHSFCTPWEACHFLLCLVVGHIFKSSVSLVLLIHQIGPMSQSDCCIKYMTNWIAHICLRISD